MGPPIDAADEATEAAERKIKGEAKKRRRRVLE